MNNKRGAIPFWMFLIIIIVGSVLAVSSVIGLIFSGTFRWIVVGSALLVVGFMFAFRSKNERLKTGLIIGTLVVGAGFILGAGILENIVVGGYIEAPFFGTVKCDRAVGGLISTASINLRDDVDGFTKVTPPLNLESYDVLLTHPGEDTLFESYKWTSSVCDIDGNNCKNIKAELIPSFGINERTIQSNVPRDEFVFFTIERRGSPFLSWEKVNEGTYKLKYQPYILFVQNSLGGGENPISGSIDCKYPTGDLKNNAILSSNVKSKEGQLFEDEIPLYRNYLEPNEAYNFISGTITRASFGNTIDYNGKTGYCAENIQGKGAVIYGIGEIKTLSNTYSVVNTFNELAVLGFDGCCNEGEVQGNRVCEDLEWVTLTEDTEPDCSFFDPCNPGRFILGEGTKTYEFNCISGKCVIGNIREENCVTNTDCKGDNEICVNFNCQKASTYCGDGICQSNEKELNPSCPQDCEEPPPGDKCLWYQEEFTKVEKDYGFGYFRAYTPFFDPIETEITGCRTSGLINIGAIVLIVIVLGSVAILSMRKPKRRKKK